MVLCCVVVRCGVLCFDMLVCVVFCWVVTCRDVLWRFGLGWVGSVVLCGVVLWCGAMCGCGMLRGVYRLCDNV